MDRPTVVVSGFVRNGDKYLLIYAPYFNEDGFWRVPGGRVEDDEKVEDTLVRELKEELNLKVKVKKFIGFGQDYVYVHPVKAKKARLVMYFECDSIGGEFMLDKKEASDHKWATIEEMKAEKKLEPAMKDLFKRFKIGGR